MHPRTLTWFDARSAPNEYPEALFIRINDNIQATELTVVPGVTE